MVNPDRVVWKIGWRLLPLLMLLFFFNFLDRVNVGFAALEMNRSIGLSPVVFGLGAGIFFLSYAICQIPSSVLLGRLNVRVWILGTAILWGLASAGMSLANGPTSFIALRFLLGIAEAGFFPGFIYYLSLWFPRGARAKFNALFLSAVPVASMIGSPLSGLILSMDDVLGIESWRWLFIIEGLPSIALGIFAFFWLSDRPANAAWLSADERRWLIDTLATEQAPAATDKPAFRDVMTDPRVVLLSVTSLLLIIGIYGIGMWLPQIVTGFGATSFENGLLSACPYLLATAVMLIWSRRSDALGERRLHLSFAAMISGAGFIASSQLTSPILALTAISVAAAFVFSASAVFWTLPTSFLAGSSAAVAIATINTVGNLGGFAGPYLVGWIKAATGSFGPALMMLGFSTIAAGALIFVSPVIFRRRRVPGFD